MSEIPRRSRIGLNAANFFQAEAVGVVLPVMNGFLREAHWRYDAIGIASAVAGLGTLIFQTPAGVLADRTARKRVLFAVASIVVGVCFVALPLVPPAAAWIDSLLFVAGAAQALFIPVLGALALALVARTVGRNLGKILGENQSWNHAGNIVAALSAIAVVRFFGLAGVFYAVGIASLLAAAVVYLVRRDDLADEVRSRDDGRRASWRQLMGDRTVLALVLSITLFHLANAPILPLTALYVKKLGGSDSLMTSTVLTAQVVMIPVAWLSGRWCESHGRKWTMAIGFWILPFRIASYTLVHSPYGIVALQALDGIGAGIYGVVSIAIAADLARGKGRFNTLIGVLATAQAVGGVAGPLGSGFITQHLGFNAAFLVFAALALCAAIVFTLLVPETRHRSRIESEATNF